MIDSRVKYNLIIYNKKRREKREDLLVNLSLEEAALIIYIYLYTSNRLLTGLNQLHPYITLYTALCPWDRLLTGSTPIFIALY